MFHNFKFYELQDPIFALSLDYSVSRSDSSLQPRLPWQPRLPTSTISSLFCSSLAVSYLVNILDFKWHLPDVAVDLGTIGHVRGGES